MTPSAAKNLLGFTLLGYALGCLALVTYFVLFPLFVAQYADDDIVEFTGTTQLPNFSAIEHTPERKQVFVDTLLPLIERKNHSQLKARNAILKLQMQVIAGQELSEKQYRLLDKMRDRFRVGHDMYPDTSKALDILLLRADVIPTSMVLAQAAVESGWGTSRFAEEAHNLFGQWCYSQGCGIVPERRAKGARHEVQLFSSIEESISAYFNNINTHNAYRELRQLRAQLREQDGALTGTMLVAGLNKYSGRGSVYIEELRTVIKANDFENLPSVPLELAARQ